MTSGDYEKLFDQISDLLEDVDCIHKAIKFCANEEELTELQN
jgi:hypothetical protein